MRLVRSVLSSQMGPGQMLGCNRKSGMRDCVAVQDIWRSALSNAIWAVDGKKRHDTRNMCLDVAVTKGEAKHP